MAYASLLSRSSWLRRDVLEEIALEAADDAVVGVLAHLDDFRGACLFTTWASRFAITEVSVAIRRRRRFQRELPVEPEQIVQLTGSRSTVEHELEQAELLRLVFHAVNQALSARQREVLLALAIDGSATEALAADLGANAGALYKSVHDARRKLRVWLAADGLTPAGELVAAVRTSAP